MSRTPRRVWAVRAILAALLVAVVGLVLSLRSSRESASNAATIAGLATSRSAATAARASTPDETNEIGPALRIAVAADAAPASEFWGRVVSDDDGRPIAGVVVTSIVDTAIEAFTPLGTSDADGFFRWTDWDLPEFELRASGHARGAGRAVAGHSSRADAREFRLRRGASLAVHVVVADGASVDAGVRVFAEDYSTKGNSWIPPSGWTAALSADGRAVLADLPPQVALSIDVSEGKDVVWETADPIVLQPGECRPIDVDLRARTRLVVTLRDASGAPVADRPLWLWRNLETPFGGPARRIFEWDDRVGFQRRTDDRGRAVFECPPGGWWIGPPADGDDVANVAQFLAVPPGTVEASVDVVADRGLFLRGRVVSSSGEPVPDAIVAARHEFVRGELRISSREDGTFVLGPLAAGPYLVEASKDDAIASEPVRGLPNGDEIAISIAAGGRISGRVFDAATGQPASALVVCSGAGEFEQWAEAVDGPFVVKELRKGVHALVATTEDGRVGIVRGLLVEQGQAVTDVQIALQSAARLRVELRGGPTYATLSIWSAGTLVTTESLRRGIARESVVPSGRLELALSSGGREIARRTIDAPTGETTEVVLEADGR
jgi:hypothetical protein